MFDIDHFKNINDKYGHNIGDKALIFLSNLVYKHIRKDDILCRWGGEEFMVLVELKVENAYTVAEHLRNIIEQDSANSNEIPDFTCSFGVLSLDDIISAEEAYNKVDTLLYKAKQNGRNRIEK
jgi:diguanylate cyclase (GGDEF)-like protein